MKSNMDLESNWTLNEIQDLIKVLNGNEEISEDGRFSPSGQKPKYAIQFKKRPYVKRNSWKEKILYWFGWHRVGQTPDGFHLIFARVVHRGLLESYVSFLLRVSNLDKDNYIGIRVYNIEKIAGLIDSFYYDFDDNYPFFKTRKDAQLFLEHYAGIYVKCKE